MDRFVYLIYSTAAGILRRLPLKFVWRLGYSLGFIGYHFAGSYRRLAQHNLRIAFGREKSEAEIRRLARGHFATLGANLFSSIKLPTLSKEELLACVDVEGLEHMDEQIVNKGGFVFVISHLGNWEMFAQLVPYIYKCKVGTIYQALGNSFIDAEVRRDRARLGLSLFERKEGFAAASKFIREGGAVGVLMDQHAGDVGVWCPFFDRLASTTTLPATLALRTKGWLIPAAIYSSGPGRWRCVLLEQIPPNGDDADAITVRLNKVLEDQIRVHPEDWFWVHNRWKTPRPNFLLADYKRGVVLPPAPAPALQPFKILIRSSNWLGDAVMTMPAVRAIKRGRPDAHVTILTLAKLVDLWKTVAEVDDIIAIAPGDSVFAVARKIGPRFDAAILLPNSIRTALEVWLAGIPRRIGYPGHRRAWLLNQVLREKKSKKAKKPKPPEHQVYHYLALAKFMGARVEDAVATDSAPILPSGDPIRIGLVPGAEYGPAKRWLPERFAEVMREAHAKFGVEWVLFGVGKDREVADAIIKDAPGIPCTDLIGKTTLAELIVELRRCHLVLTNDTGTMHLAASLDVPVVAIFGSTEPTLTGPLDRLGRPESDRHVLIRQHVECSPCFLRECPIDFRCMKAVASAEVLAAIERQLRAIGCLPPAVSLPSR